MIHLYSRTILSTINLFSSKLLPVLSFWYHYSPFVCILKMFNADVYFSQQACNITFESGGGNLIEKFLDKQNIKKRKIPLTPTMLIRGEGVFGRIHCFPLLKFHSLLISLFFSSVSCMLPKKGEGPTAL